MNGISAQQDGLADAIASIPMIMIMIFLHSAYLIIRRAWVDLRAPNVMATTHTIP